MLVRIRVGNESIWCRGLSLGLLFGCALGAILELLQGQRPRAEVVVRRAQASSSTGRSTPTAVRRVATAVPEAEAEAEAIVAVCVGGWLELTYPRRAQSVADNVFSVMPSEAFVAGTVRGGNLSEARTAAALSGIGALQPWFARTSVILMPTPADLRRELERSGHFRDYEVRGAAAPCRPRAAEGGRAYRRRAPAWQIQASKGGSGRFDFKSPNSADPTTWVPIMMSPALGNPNGNTLQERHCQSEP